MEQSIPKRQYIKFRRREITQKKEYNNCKYISGREIIFEGRRWQHLSRFTLMHKTAQFFPYVMSHRGRLNTVSHCVGTHEIDYFNPIF